MKEISQSLHALISQCTPNCLSPPYRWGKRVYSLHSPKNKRLEILWNPTVLMINVHPQSAIKLLIIVEQFHFHQHTKAVGGYFRLLSLILKDNNTW